MRRRAHSPVDTLLYCHPTHIDPSAKNDENPTERVIFFAYVGDFQFNRVFKNGDKSPLDRCYTGRVGINEPQQQPQEDSA